MEGIYNLKRVGVWKLTFTGLILGFFLGLFSGLIIALMGGTAIAFIGAMFDIAPATIASLPKFIWIVTSIIGGIGGMLIALLSAVVFNLSISMLGGVKLYLDDESHSSLAIPPITPQYASPQYAPVQPVQIQQPLQTPPQVPIQPLPVQQQTAQQTQIPR